MILKPSSKCQELKEFLSDESNKNKNQHNNISYDDLVEFIKFNGSNIDLLDRLFKRRKDLIDKHYENLMADYDICANSRMNLLHVVKSQYDIKPKNEDCKRCILMSIVILMLGAFIVLLTLDIYANFLRPDPIQKITVCDYNSKSKNNINASRKYKIDYQGSINQAMLQNDYLTVEKILNMALSKNMTSKLNATEVLINATNSDQLTIDLFNTLILAGADLKSNCWENSLKVLDKHCDWYPMMNVIPLPELLICSNRHQLALECIINKVSMHSLIISFCLDNESSLLTEIDGGTQRNIIKTKIYERIDRFIKSNSVILSLLIVSISVFMIRTLCFRNNKNRRLRY